MDAQKKEHYRFELLLTLALQILGSTLLLGTPGFAQAPYALILSGPILSGPSRLPHWSMRSFTIAECSRSIERLLSAMPGQSS